MEAANTNETDGNDDDVVFLNYILPQDRVPHPEQIVDVDNETAASDQSQVIVLANGNNNHDHLLQQSVTTETSLKPPVQVPHTSSCLPSHNATSSECSICFEPYVSQGDKRCVVTPCGHLFCYSCIAMVFSNSTKSKPACCPKCRTVFKKNVLKSLITLYDTDKVIVSDPSVVNQYEDTIKQKEQKVSQVQLTT